jgi:dUTP pyrophosphatase
MPTHARIKGRALQYKAVTGVTVEAHPSKSYPGDAGFDLTVSRSVEVAPGAFASIPTNLAIALPAGHWGLLVGRSSTFHKKGLIVNTSIIDNGYRGEIFALVFNPSKQRIITHKGERLFQLIPLPLAAIAAREVDTLPPSERDTKGFGSSGGFAPASEGGK